jgi:hypothetical protein
MDKKGVLAWVKGYLKVIKERLEKVHTNLNPKPSPPRAPDPKPKTEEVARSPKP